MDIEENLKKFKEEIKLGRLNEEQIFQKYLVDSNSYFFNVLLKDNHQEYFLKTIISKYLGIHINEIVIVGSAKLGFSLSPKNLFNKFDYKFEQTKQRKYRSDIDIAIISPSLFERINKEVFEYTNSFKEKWSYNEYYNGAKLEEFKVPVCYKCFEYLSKGWFRPDFKPAGFDFCTNGSLVELNAELYSITKRKTSIGIYKDWYFFKDYHINNVKSLSYLVKTSTI